MKKDQRSHCSLERLLTEEEIVRLEDLFRQQGIEVEHGGLMAKVQQTGERDHCPFRYTLAHGVDFCASECHLAKLFVNEAETHSL